MVLQAALINHDVNLMTCLNDIKWNLAMRQKGSQGNTVGSHTKYILGLGCQKKDPRDLDKINTFY